MQLIVGCRARGASWAGSETLVIPRKRLTIHVRVCECMQYAYTYIDFTSVCTYTGRFILCTSSCINIRVKIYDVHLNVI